MIEQKRLQLQMKIVQKDYLKNAVRWEQMKLLTAKDLNLLRGIFLMGEMSKFLAVGQDFSPSPGLPIKVQEKGNSPHLVGATILGNNPAGHSFVLRDLVLIELSGHAPPPTSLEEGLKISEKLLLGRGVAEILVLVGGLFCWGVIFIKCIC